MIKVNKDFNNVPPALHRGFEAVRENLFNAKVNHKFDGRIYNNAIVADIKLLYQGKCAYCETYMGDNDITIEHYRPKGGTYSYWWLGYEWSNLLPVCKKCNNRKGGKFPIAVPERAAISSLPIKTRVRKPLRLPDGNIDMEAMKANHPYLLDEKPYLLHPEIDDPKDFFKILPTGMFDSLIVDESTHNYKRSKETIELTNLNRDLLIYRRREKIKQFEDRLQANLKSFLEIDPNRLYKTQEQWDGAIKLAFFSVFKDFKKAEIGNLEYSFTVWYTWDNINEILFVPICSGVEDYESLLNYALYLFLKLPNE